MRCINAVHLPFTVIPKESAFLYRSLRRVCVVSSPSGLCRLEGTEDKFRNRESRPEDLQVIAELKDMVTEREALVKKLVVGRWREGRYGRAHTCVSD